jgi:hypothetical protein
MENKMKKIIAAIIIILSKNAFALVLEVNEGDKKIFYHPTPALVLNLTDLGSDGGFLTAFLDYSNQKTKAEYNEISSQYLNYDVQVLGAEPVSGIVTLKIPKASFLRELTIRNGQLGPYINSNFDLKKDEVDSLLRVKDLESEVILTIDVKSSYSSSQVIEAYHTDSGFCEQLKVKDVSDLMQTLISLKRPREIKFNQTFDSLKRSIIDQCFEAEPSVVNNFNELMNTQLKVNRAKSAPLGKYLENLWVKKEYQIKPHVTLEKNN